MWTMILPCSPSTFASSLPRPSGREEVLGAETMKKGLNQAEPVVDTQAISAYRNVQPHACTWV